MAENPYLSLSEEMFVSLHLQTMTNFSPPRDSVLHFCDLVQKKFPFLEKFTANKGQYCLEQEKNENRSSWLSVESKRLCGSMTNANSLSEIHELFEFALDLAGPTLGLHRLDCEWLDLVYGFEYQYRGNHSELLGRILGVPSSLESLAHSGDGILLDYSPVIQIAVDSDVKTLARAHFESRTTPAQIRQNDYDGEPLSVYLSMRRIESLSANESFVSEYQRLDRLLQNLLDQRLVEQVLQPLQSATAIQ